MELCLMMDFCDLSENELELIDAGGLLDWAAAVGGVYSTAVGVLTVVGQSTVACAATCAAIASAPVVATTAVVAGVACTGYSIYCAINS